MKLTRKLTRKSIVLLAPLSLLLLGSAACKSAKYDGDTTAFVPPIVTRELRRKLGLQTDEK